MPSAGTVEGIFVGRRPARSGADSKLVFCDALEAGYSTACNPVAYADWGSKGTPLAHFFPPFLWASKEMGRGVGRGAPQICCT